MNNRKLNKLMFIENLLSILFILSTIFIVFMMYKLYINNNEFGLVLISIYSLLSTILIIIYTIIDYIIFKNH